jgi:hypothetical protein
MHLREEKKWGKDNGFGFQNKTETERHSKSDLIIDIMRTIILIRLTGI